MANIKFYECANCLITGTDKMKLCSGCNCTYYCSAACQNADWKAFHKDECKLLKEKGNIITWYKKELNGIISILETAKHAEGFPVIIIKDSKKFMQLYETSKISGEMNQNIEIWDFVVYPSENGLPMSNYFSLFTDFDMKSPNGNDIVSKENIISMVRLYSLEYKKLGVIIAPDVDFLHFAAMKM